MQSLFAAAAGLVVSEPRLTYAAQFGSYSEADPKPYAIPLDFTQPILPQLRDLFFSLLEAPYSAFVSNLLLVALACVFVASGLLIPGSRRIPKNAAAS